MVPADCDADSEQCDGCENVFHRKNILVVDSQGNEDSQQWSGKKCKIFCNHSQQWWEETIHILRRSLDFFFF